MVTIKQERIFSFNTNIEFKSSSHELIMNSGVMLRPIVPPSNKELVLLVVSYDVSPFIAEEGIKLESELVLPFTLQKAKYITIQDLYKCVEMTHEMIQSIFDKIFLGKERMPVMPVEFDLLKDKLIAHLADIHSQSLP